MKDAARLVYTLRQMAPQDAELFGISERETPSLHSHGQRQG